MLYEPLVYRGKEQKISVKIGAKNIKKAINGTVKLMRNGVVTAVKSVFIDTLGTIQTVDFNDTPIAVGRIKFKVMLEDMVADANSRNNTFRFVQQVLKRKLQIAIFSGAPDYEGKFLNQLLSDEKDFECSFFYENRRNHLKGKNKYQLKSEFDVLIFQDFPGPFTSTEVIADLRELLQKRKSSLLLFLGEKADRTKINSILKYTPFSKLPKRIRPESSISFNPEKSPLLDLFEDPSANTQFWQKIPPVTLIYSAGKLRNGVEPLLKSNGRPILLSYSRPGYRNITFIGSGFWRWHFLMQNSGIFGSGYASLLKHIIRWLAAKKDIKPVMVQADVTKTVPGNTVHISAYIYDVNYLPVRDGTLRLQVKQGNEVIDLEAVMDSSGRYQAEFVPLTEGTLLIKAQGFRFDQLYGSAQLQIDIAAAKKEFIHTGLNRRYLRQIARKSRGLYSDAANIDSLLSQIPQNSTFQKEKRVFEFWYNPYLLALILFVIISEWILRRRFGLV